MSAACSLCHKKFSTQFNLNKHLREIHKSRSKYIEYTVEKKYTCAECNVYFNFNNDLRKHLEEKHDFENVVEELHFDKYTAFTEWLLKEENSNNVQYSKNSGRKKSGKNREKIYFECIRSYRKQNLLKGERKRRLKWQGSCKMPKSCASQIVVTKDIKSDACTVLYYKSHYLHDTDVKYLRKPKPVKDRTALVHSLGAPYEQDQTVESNLQNNISAIEMITSNLIIPQEDLKTWNLQKSENNVYIITATTSNDGHMSFTNNIEEQDQQTQHLTSEMNICDRIKEKIETNMYEILQTFETGKLSCEQLKLILEHTNICVALATRDQDDKSESMKEPRDNNNVVKQISLLSNENKPEDVSMWSQISGEGSLNIDNEVEDREIVISCHADNDHRYCN